MPQTQSRKGAVTFKGNPLTLLGRQVEVGDEAPDFEVAANDLSTVRGSDLFGRKVVILTSVPSLDTSVCDRETRRFNEEAAGLGEGVQVVTVSMDLPFAQARWCGAAGIDRVRTLSDYKEGSFGRAFGVLIEELHLLARAVFVVDREGVVRYRQLVGEVTQEPDYASALAAARNLA